MEGLVDCGSSTEFYDKLEACKPMWELLETIINVYHWFVKYKSKVEEDSMLHNVGQEAGISVCAGCHRKYKIPAEAPYDLGIRHEEWHKFTTPGNPSLQRRFGNAYYHPFCACIRSRWPYVQSGDISVDKIKEHLLPARQMFLAEHLGLYA